MDPVTLALLAGVVVLILASALLSAAETATFSLGRLPAPHPPGGRLRRRGRAGGGAGPAGGLPDVAPLVPAQRPGPRWLTWLAGALAGAPGCWRHPGGGSASPWPWDGGPSVLVVAEILPRGVAARYPVRRGTGLGAPPAGDGALEPSCSPARPAAGGAGVGAERRRGAHGRGAGPPGLTELGREEGVVGTDERLLVERAFRLDELTAWDVMTPRVAVFAWQDALPWRTSWGS